MSFNSLARLTIESINLRPLHQSTSLDGRRPLLTSLRILAVRTRIPCSSLPTIIIVLTSFIRNLLQPIASRCYALGRRQNEVSDPELPRRH